MLKPRFPLFNAEPGQGGGGAPTPAAQSATPSNPPALTQADIDAAVKKALEAQGAQFSATLKELTGVDSLDAFKEAQLKQQGKTTELLDAKASEAARYKSLYEQSAIQSALLLASGEAVDPATVSALLSGRARVDAQGAVTIDGKPAAEAVKALLTEKPFLAKPQGGSGSGAAQGSGQSVKNPWTKDSFNLTEQIQLERANPTLASQLKAQAGAS
jgi:hypothetical protein